MLVKSRRNVTLPFFVDGFFGNEFLEGFSNDEAKYSQPAINIAENSTEFKIELAQELIKKNLNLMLQKKF